MSRGRRIPDLVAGLPKTQAALAFAERRHAGQQRNFDGAPFIEHPREVASLLYYTGAPDHVIAAGALHDVIEKTPADAAELRSRFGPRVTTLVLALSEDVRIADYEARKTALRDQVAAAGEEALTVFAADKVSKARELRREASRRTRSRNSLATASGSRRLRHYRRCLDLLDERLTDSPLVRQLRTELERLPSGAVALPAFAPAR